MVLPGHNGADRTPEISDHGPDGGAGGPSRRRSCGADGEGKIRKYARRIPSLVYSAGLGRGPGGGGPAARSLGFVLPVGFLRPHGTPPEGGLHEMVTPEELRAGKKLRWVQVSCAGIEEFLD